MAKDKQPDCVCPKDWSWSNDRCVQDCPKELQRNEQGQCVAQLTQASTAWEKADPAPRLKCPSSWKRASDGSCTFPAIAPPNVPKNTDVGPNKKCPTDKSDKWDEDYLTRAKLPTETKVFYVDSQASEGGDGSKSQPYKTIPQALQRAIKGSVILLAPGKYRWGQVIDRSVHIIGRCTTEVRFDANDASPTANIGLTISSSDTTLEGFTMIGNQNSEVGLSFVGSTSTTSVRHVNIRNIKDAGLRVINREATIEHIEVSGAVGDKGVGVLILEGARNVTLSLSRIDGSKQAGIRILAQTKETGLIQIKQNLISKNGTHAIEIDKATTKIQIEQNLIEKNGAQLPQDGAITIQAPDGDVSLLRNVIKGNLPHGLKSNECKSLTLEGNWFESNAVQQGFSVAAWALKGTTLRATGNLFASFGSVGVMGSLLKDIDISSNHFKGAGLAGPIVSGVAIVSQDSDTPAQPVRTLKVENNLFEGTGNDGIMVDLVEEASISHNHIKGTKLRGITFGAFKSGLGLKAQWTLEGNFVEAGQHAGIALFDIPEATVKGNHIQGGKGSSRSIRLRDGNKVQLIGNKIESKGTGIDAHSVAFVSIKENQLRGPVSRSDTITTGIRLHNITKELTLQHNDIRSFDRGGWVERLPKSCRAQLVQNVWSQHRFAGLTFRDNANTIEVREQLFRNNAGRHLEVLNQGGLLSLLGNGFANAKAADAEPTNTWGPSAGMGIFVGSQGLVRDVFVERAALCGGALGTPTQDGKLALPLRIPHELDPCLTWNDTNQPLEERRLASPCGKCFKENKKCRWTASIEGDKDKEQLVLGDITCVDAAKGSCQAPTTTPKGGLRSTTQERLVEGRCVALKDGQDFCQSNLTCGAFNESKYYYCARTKGRVMSDQQEGWNALCHAISDRGPCHPSRTTCPADQACVSSQPILEPANAVPSSVLLKRNIFWDNPGPDIVFGQAGRVTLESNFFFTCTEDNPSTCPTKKGHRWSTKDERWEEVSLARGATIIWQRPSPHKKAAYLSDLRGIDATFTSNGFPIMITPGLCGSLDVY